MDHGTIDGLVFSRETAKHFYVDEAGGDDDDSGIEAAPLQALDEALRRAATLSQQDVATVIHLKTHGEGGYSMTAQPRVLGAPIVIYADDVWDSGVFEIFSTGTSDVGTGGGIVIDDAGGLIVDTFQRFFIEMTSGAAIGQRRIIRNNTATDIIPAAVFDPAPTTGDTFRLYRPLVTITISPGGANEVNTFPGSGDSWAGRKDQPGALVLANLQLLGPAPPVQWGLNLPLVMYGCQATMDSIESSASVWAGCDQYELPNEESFANIPAALLGASDNKAWHGYGVSFGSVLPIFSVEKLHAFLGADALFFTRGANFIHGGVAESGIICVESLLLRVGHNLDTTDFLVPSGPVLAVQQTNVSLNKASMGANIVASVGGRILVASGVTGQASSGPSVDVSAGGQVTLVGVPAYGDATAKDYGVENGLPQNKAFFAVPAVLVNDDTGSRILGSG